MTESKSAVALAGAAVGGVVAGFFASKLVWHFKRRQCRKSEPKEEPVQKYVKSLSPEGFHKVAYVEWGNPHNPNIVVCCHGLTRNSRDFDFLAKRLSSRYRVISVDVVGRGKSDYLNNKQLYGYAQYTADMAALLAQVCRQGQSVTWVGTSMGGLIGMLLAATPKSPIKQLVMNDIGPFLPKEALSRIAQYVGKAPNFDTLPEVEAYLRKNYEPQFGGQLSAEHWRHLALHSSVVEWEKEEFRLSYDRDIAVPFAAAAATNKDVDMWPIWAKITCPVLVLHGEISDVLPADVAKRMKSIGEGKEPAGPTDVTVIDYKGVGHMPPLVGSDIDDVEKWIVAKDTTYATVGSHGFGRGGKCGGRSRCGRKAS